MTPCARVCHTGLEPQTSRQQSAAHTLAPRLGQDWFDRASKCPTCAKALDPRHGAGELRLASPLAWRVLGRLRMKCPLLGPLGAPCGWRGEYSELTTHMTAADSHQVPCHVVLHIVHHVVHYTVHCIVHHMHCIVHYMHSMVHYMQHMTAARLAHQVPCAAEGEDGPGMRQRKLASSEALKVHYMYM